VITALPFAPSGSFGARFAPVGSVQIILTSAAAPKSLPLSSASEEQIDISIYSAIRNLTRSTLESGTTLVAKNALPFPKTFMKPALSSVEKVRDTLQWNPKPARPIVEFIPELIDGLGDDVGIQ